MSFIKKISLFAAILWIGSSCITQKQYEAMDDKASELTAENEVLKTENHNIGAENKELE